MLNLSRTRKGYVLIPSSTRQFLILGENSGRQCDHDHIKVFAPWTNPGIFMTLTEEVSTNQWAFYNLMHFCTILRRWKHADGTIHNNYGEYSTFISICRSRVLAPQESVIEQVSQIIFSRLPHTERPIDKKRNSVCVMGLSKGVRCHWSGLLTCRRGWNGKTGGLEQRSRK